MPRSARASAGGYCYHVINRGNARAEVFHKDEDLDAFVRVMGEATIRVPMRVVAYCLMTNHFHLVLWPRADGDLSRWMHWLLTTHVRRYLRHYRHNGNRRPSGLGVQPPTARTTAPFAAHARQVNSKPPRLRIVRRIIKNIPFRRPVGL